MKKNGLLLSIILVLVNIVIGSIISSIGWLNILFSSLAIILTCMLLMHIWKDDIRDAYKISESFVLGIMGIIEYFISIFMPVKYEDNYAFIAILVLFVLSISMYLVIKKVSQINSNK